MEKSLKFKKKPVVIEALQWNGKVAPFLEFFGERSHLLEADTEGEKLVLSTTKGDITADFGDWVIREGDTVIISNAEDFEATYSHLDEDNNYHKHARREFAAAGWDILSAAEEKRVSEVGFRDEKTGDAEVDRLMQSHMCNNVLELLTVFADEGYSGSTAPYAMNLFQQLAAFEPISPLTGADDEWDDRSEMSGEPFWQNNRCSDIFKGADGQAYRSSGIVFEYADGAGFTSRNSRVDIEFPWTYEKARRVKVGADDEPLKEPSEIEKAVDTLKAAFEKEPDYAHVWHCNIAMAFQDASHKDRNLHESANEGASRFMKSLFGIETSNDMLDEKEKSDESN